MVVVWFCIVVVPETGPMYPPKLTRSAAAITITIIPTGYQSLFTKFPYLMSMQII